MASSSNKLIPIVTLAGVAIVGAVLFVQFKGGGAVKPGADLKAVPSPTLPKTSDADHDTPDETLKTVATSNEKLRKQVEDVVAANKTLMEENRKLQAGKKPEPPSPLPATTPASDAAAQAPAAPAAPASPIDLAITSVGKAADTFSQGLPGAAPHRAGAGGVPASYAQAPAAPGAVSYAVMAPMGYAVQTEKARGQGQGQGVEMTRYVRTLQGGAPLAGAGQGGPASRAAQQAKAKEPVPYFTIPENGTLAGAIGMTALIGRVPIDGRVTDPMQFKAVIGRDNLAANGFELPPDVSGIIVSGVAIGDMALSCVEGRVHSATFVFNDGTINTVSTRRRGGNRSVNTQGGQDDDALGFISDEHGNPCIPGQFVTNAPRYLTDVVGLGVLGVAGQAYAEAQRTTYSGYDGSASAVTGNVGQYALGQAVSGGTNEVTKWMLQRMKNSFDAVIIPSGKKMVIHMDREMKIDKAPNARKLVHRWQAHSQLASGAHHGLE